jgi:hypothetical protein
LERELEDVGRELEELEENDYDLFKPKIELSEIEKIVLYLSEGDLSKRENILNTDYETAMSFYYYKLVKRLNELKQYVSILKKREAQND